VSTAQSPLPRLAATPLLLLLVLGGELGVGLLLVRVRVGVMVGVRVGVRVGVVVRVRVRVRAPSKG